MGSLPHSNAVVRRRSSHPDTNERRPAPVRRGSSPAPVTAPPRRGLDAEARYIDRGPEQIIVVKTVLDSDLKHLLAIFGVLVAAAFVAGLILWVLT